MIGRRRLLQALGLTGLGTMLPSLRGSSVNAQPTASPSRLVLYYTAHGAPGEQWQMPMGRDPMSMFEYDLTALNRDQFSRALAPLYDHRDQLLVVQGLSELSHMEDERLHGRERHGAAAGSIFSGAGRFGAQSSAGRSLDQIVADSIAVPGRFRSLEYSTRGAQVSPSWSAPGERIEPERSVSQAFDRLFPAGGMEPPEPTQESLIRGHRGSVLDFAAAEFSSIAPRLSRDDRDKLERHATMIRDIEARITELGSISCGEATEPSSGDRVRDLMQLATLAMSCDLTRVVTISEGQLPGSDFGHPGADVHQDFAHHGGDVSKREGMGDYYAAHAADFAFFLDQLDSVPEGDGTLLDHTTVVWLTELATGDHTLWDMMAVVAGGPLRKGRYVNYPMNRQNPLEARHGLVGRGHNELLLTVAQATGSDATQIGKASVTDVDGGTIPLDRTLDELF